MIGKYKRNKSSLPQIVFSHGLYYNIIKQTRTVQIYIQCNIILHNLKNEKTCMVNLEDIKIFKQEVTGHILHKYICIVYICTMYKRKAKMIKLIEA